MTRFPGFSGVGQNLGAFRVLRFWGEATAGGPSGRPVTALLLRPAASEPTA